MAELMPCPCGQIPERLVVEGEGRQPKWARVSGNCCGSWSIEYRNGYMLLDTEKADALAVNAWNAAPRAKQEAGG